MELTAADKARWYSGKESACQCSRWSIRGFNPWAGKILWRRERQPTPIFLPGKFHGQKSLAGYSLWGRKVSHDWAIEHMHSIYWVHTLLASWWICPMRSILWAAKWGPNYHRPRLKTEIFSVVRQRLIILYFLRYLKGCRHVVSAQRIFAKWRNY